MQREIEKAHLEHYFVRNRLNEQEFEKLADLLYENPNLLEYIAIDHTIYQIGLRLSKND